MSKETRYQPGWRKHKQANVSVTTSVRTLRWFLPVGFVCALLVIYVASWRPSSEISLSYAPLKKILSLNPHLENTLINPVFHSLDKKSQPYVFRAEKAVQNSSIDTNLYNLDGHIQLSNGEIIYFSAQKGAYDRDTDLLTMQDNVTVSTKSGYILETKSAMVKPKSSSIESNDATHGKGPFNQTMSSDSGFIIFNETGHLILKGKSHIKVAFK